MIMFVTKWRAKGRNKVRGGSHQTVECLQVFFWGAQVVLKHSHTIRGQNVGFRTLYSYSFTHKPNGRYPPLHQGLKEFLSYRCYLLAKSRFGTKFSWGRPQIRHISCFFHDVLPTLWIHGHILSMGWNRRSNLIQLSNLPKNPDPQKWLVWGPGPLLYRFKPFHCRVQGFLGLYYFQQIWFHWTLRYNVPESAGRPKGNWLGAGT